LIGHPVLVVGKSWPKNNKCSSDCQFR